MSLLTTLIVKKSYIWVEFILPFWKIDLYQIWKAFNTKIWPQWQDREGSYQVRKILVLFWKLIVLILH